VRVDRVGEQHDLDDVVAIARDILHDYDPENVPHAGGPSIGRLTQIHGEPRYVTISRWLVQKIGPALEHLGSAQSGALAIVGTESHGGDHLDVDSVNVICAVDKIAIRDAPRPLGADDARRLAAALLLMADLVERAV
jgi:hypothetical protein